MIHGKAKHQEYIAYTIVALVLIIIIFLRQFIDIPREAIIGVMMAGCAITFVRPVWLMFSYGRIKKTAERVTADVISKRTEHSNQPVLTIRFSTSDGRIRTKDVHGVYSAKDKLVVLFDIRHPDSLLIPPHCFIVAAG